MNKANNEITQKKERDGIENYFQCITYCSIQEQEDDCKTICMERHLKPNYF